ncbi:MAG: FAD-dependent oxidoreductase [Thermomicrobiales bacterium]
MPYYIGGLVDDADSLIARSPEAFREQGIDVRTRHEVEEIDAERRTVLVRDLGTRERSTEPYDNLVIATGAEPAVPDLPGIQAGGIFKMSWMHDMLALDQYLVEHQCRRAVIVGGGYIGIEMAEALLLRELETTLIHSRRAVMPSLDEDLGLLINGTLTDEGVNLITSQRAVGFEARDGRVTAVRTEEASYPADIVILCLGTRPRSDLASAAGVPVGPSGGIIVNDRMMTAKDGICAAGDCTEMRHLVTGEQVSVALGTIANKQGRICGINLAGGDASFPGILGTAITRFCDLEIARTGLNERQLIRRNIDYVAGKIESSTRSGYFPGSSSITVKVTAERETGKLLGGQIVGGPGAGKRIDTLATALFSGLTLTDLEYLDLSYAPPFSPVWDPVQIAARIGARQVGSPKTAI